MRPSFPCDDKAISPVIGFALVLAIVVSTLGYVQTKFVPVWNAEFESGHFENVYQDLTLFSSNLESAAISGIPRTSPVRLGLIYPKRGIFYNPKPALFGSIEVKQDVWVNITYTTVFNTTTKSYPSSILKYDLPGNHPYLVYEHGIVIRDFSRFGRPNATGSPNTLIVGDEINIPLLIINGSGFSKVRVEPEILALYPIALTEKKNFVEYLKYVNITMDTHYPDAWNLTLRKHEGWNNTLGKIITSKTIAYVDKTTSPAKIYINTTAGNEIDLPEHEKQVTQEGRLYAGMAVVKTAAMLEPYKSIGEEPMSFGSVWKDVPPPDEITQFILTNITIDPNQEKVYSTKGDLIVFKVVDIYDKYWFVSLYFSTSKQDEIDYIVGRTSLGSETNNTDIPVTSATRIDLLNSVFQGIGSYRNSSMSTPNSLVSIYVGDATYADPGNSPLINYRLIIR